MTPDPACLAIVALLPCQPLNLQCRNDAKATTHKLITIMQQKDAATEKSCDRRTRKMQHLKRNAKRKCCKNQKHTKPRNKCRTEIHVLSPESGESLAETPWLHKGAWSHVGSGFTSFLYLQCFSVAAFLCCIQFMWLFVFVLHHFCACSVCACLPFSATV